MKILYLHGFGSCWKPDHPKSDALSTLGSVQGIDLCYENGFDGGFKKTCEHLENESVDLIVGSCLGGHMAAWVSEKTALPFVALNPIVWPSVAMKPWVGVSLGANSRDIWLTNTVVNSYPNMCQVARGIVIQETGDCVESYWHKHQYLSDYAVFKIQGGDHSFVHMDQAVKIVKENVKYLLDDDS